MMQHQGRHDRLSRAMNEIGLDVEDAVKSCVREGSFLEWIHAEWCSLNTGLNFIEGNRFDGRNLSLS